MASLFQVFFMKGMAVAMRMTASAYNRPAAIKWPVRKLTRYSMGIVVAPFDGTGTKNIKIPIRLSRTNLALMPGLVVFSGTSGVFFI